MLQDDLEAFFRDLALNSDTHSVDYIRQFYFGFIRTIMADLKRNKKCELPGFGTFYVLNQRPKMVGMTKEQVKAKGVKSTAILKFSPNYRAGEIIKLHFDQSQD